MEVLLAGLPYRGMVFIRHEAARTTSVVQGLWGLDLPVGAQMEETPGMALCVKIKLLTTATSWTLNGVKVLPAVSTQAI